MRFPVQKTMLAISLATLSNAVIAAGEPEPTTEPEGVLLDISQVDPRNDPDSAIFEPSLDTGNYQKARVEPLASAAPIVVETSGADTAVAPKVATAKVPPVAAAPKKTTGTIIKTIKTPAKPAAEAAPKDNRRAEEVLGAITDAMRPEEKVPALSNDRLSFYLSEQVVFAQYERSAERFNLENGRTHLGLLYSEERDTVIQGGLALDASFTNSFRLSFGTRAYIALLSKENEDAFAAALGAETAYKLPFKALPLEFGASLYYAPDILTFGTADRAIDAQVDVTFPVRSQLSVFGGYRFLQIDARPDDREVDNRLHLGVRWDFM